MPKLFKTKFITPQDSHQCTQISFAMKEVIDLSCKALLDAAHTKSCGDAYQKFILFANQCIRHHEPMADTGHLLKR